MKINDKMSRTVKMQLTYVTNKLACEQALCAKKKMKCFLLIFFFARKACSQATNKQIKYVFFALAILGRCGDEELIKKIEQLTFTSRSLLGAYVIKKIQHSKLYCNSGLEVKACSV